MNSGFSAQTRKVCEREALSPAGGIRVQGLGFSSGLRLGFSLGSVVQLVLHVITYVYVFSIESVLYRMCSL